ncbi:hypothetical protein PsorP6_014853 [Peronosclerospora sorghi]|uniref:Uncharacterized protein n=1 Tax=Peronosclerospora sorghi TaxID=230839 RepID=A0ACC0VTA5_9STRA|nr:hypothetical protein PsorP6_014853 [Peronosclerospora sorghi]
MHATKDETAPVVGGPTDGNDSDEAPEVLNNQVASFQALNQRRKEKEARVHSKDAAKRKRKNKQETKVSQLPHDVLSAVAARHKEVEADEEDKVAIEERRKMRLVQSEAKILKRIEKKSHTKQFGNIHVQTLETLEQTQTRELSASAKKFLELRSAPHRKRMNVLEGHPSQFTKRQKNRSARI